MRQGLGNEAKARSLSSDRFQRSGELRGLAIAGRSAIEGRRSPQASCAIPSFVGFLPESKKKTRYGCGAITRALVDIESTTGGEAAAGEYLYAHLAKLANRTGGVAERMAVTAQRFNVLASWGTPAVTMSTHIDTVPPFFASREDDEFIWGRGSCDAKGIIAAMVAAAERLLAREREISGFVCSG